MGFQKFFGHVRVVSCIAIVVAVGCLLPAAVESGKGEEPRPFVLPVGDAVAGESVFIRLECYSCHNVSGKSYEEAKGREPIGPELNATHAAQSRESIAGRLISYDRFLSEGHYKATYSRSDGSSRMANFNDVMTVRDLIDLVEFIKSIK